MHLIDVCPILAALHISVVIHTLKHALSCNWNSYSSIGVMYRQIMVTGYNVCIQFVNFFLAQIASWGKDGPSENGYTDQVCIQLLLLDYVWITYVCVLSMVAWLKWLPLYTWYSHIKGLKWITFLIMIL